MKNKFLNNLKSFLNKNFFNLSLLLLLFFVLFQEFKIFNNIYSILTKDHDTRAAKAYENSFFSGFCEKSSHGYLYYIKNKFSEKIKSNKIPKIINNFNGKMEYWIFLDVNAEITDDYLIILNKKDKLDISNYKILDNFNNKCFFLEKNSG